MLWYEIFAIQVLYFSIVFPLNFDISRIENFLFREDLIFLTREIKSSRKLILAKIYPNKVFQG